MTERAFERLRRALGRAIRSKREALGESQESFAHLVGVHRTYLGGVERGERNPSLRNLQRIAASLRVSLSDLIRDAEGQPGPKSRRRARRQ